MITKRRRSPAYSFHKATGQARVRIHGKDIYLGPYDSAESRDRYDDLIAEWRIKNTADSYTITVDDLALLFLEHAKQHYRKNGRETSEVCWCARLYALSSLQLAPLEPVSLVLRL